MKDHRTNYPETIIHNGVIRVEITASTRQFPQQRVQQLAHEAIYCLVASGRRDTIYLEEGLAHHFVYTYGGLPHEYRHENAKMLHPIFKPPVDAFKALKATDGQIRALRVDFPTMTVTPDDVLKYCDVKREIAEAVCERMPLLRPDKM